jgi:hypothetical protein
MPSPSPLAPGVPRYGQMDPRWRDRILGVQDTIGQSGCAISSTAVALSVISGDPIDPGALDQFLDDHQGYVDDKVVWNVASRARGLSARKPDWDLGTIDRFLDAGHPVVIGVSYKEGSAGGADGTDHWVALIPGALGDRYLILDTANEEGSVHELACAGDALEGRGANGLYRTTGQLVVFEPAPGPDLGEG